MTNKNPIVQFKFFDTNANPNLLNLNQFLKSKFREPTTKSNYIFTRSTDFQIKQWEIVCDSLGSLASLLCVKTIGNCEKYCWGANDGSNPNGHSMKSTILLEHEKNELIYWDRGRICIWKLSNTNKCLPNVQFIDLANPDFYHTYSLHWCFTKEKKLIANFRGEIVIINWETKKIIEKIKRSYICPPGEIIYIKQQSGELFGKFSDSLVIKYRLSEENTIQFLNWFDNCDSDTRTFAMLNQEETLFAISSWCNKHILIYQTDSTKQVYKKHVGCEPACMIYSIKLNLLVFCSEETIYVWDLIVSDNVKIELKYQIQSPFNFRIIIMEFIDPSNPNQVLAGDLDGNLFVFNLATKAIIWFKSKAHDCIIGSIKV